MLHHLLNIGIAVLIAGPGTFSLSKSEVESKKLLLLGNNAISIGRGGTGLSSPGLASIRENPAVIAVNSNVMFSLNYGSPFTDVSRHRASCAFSVPTSFGIYGGSVDYVSMSGASDFTRGYDATIGAGKALSRSLSLGFSMRYFTVTGNSRGHSGGFTIGGIYRFADARGKKGFGIINPAIGVAVNAMYPWQGQMNDLNAAHIGYSFIFFQHSIVRIAFNNDFSAINYRNFPVKWGLEIEFINAIIIRAGFCYPYYYGTDFSAGAGFRFNLYGFRGRLDYAFVHDRRNAFGHYIGFTGDFGITDYLPPRTEIVQSDPQISPNSDGYKDYAVFRIKTFSLKDTRFWRLSISNSSGEVVREFGHSLASRDAGLTARLFFSNMFKRRENLVVPQRIIWDGTDRAGMRVPDGKYSYTFFTADEIGNVSVPQHGVIIINSVQPEVFLKAFASRMTLKEGKGQDSVVIQQQIKPAGDVRCRAGFKDFKDSIVRSFSWELGGDMPASVKWDGLDDNGQPVDDGFYTYFCVASDNAGNSVTREIKDIRIIKEVDRPYVSASVEFSSRPEKELIHFTPMFGKTKTSSDWSVDLLNRRQKVVGVIKGSDNAQKSIQWNGSIEEKPLSDGTYYYRMKGTYNNGDSFHSCLNRIVIDRKGPLISLSHSPGVFTPDNDGIDDQVLIKTRTTDLSGVRDWKIVIRSSSGEIFRSIAGKGPIPHTLLWNGRGDRQEFPESSERYTITVEATDHAGNRGISPVDTIQSGILLYPSEAGFRMRLSTVSFRLGSTYLKMKSRFILDDVFSIITRYDNYSIVVEGHTDDVGDEDENLALSEKMAYAVANYLVRKGIGRKRISYIGMGESSPLFQGPGIENRRRNRRIEFVLKKMD